MSTPPSDPPTTTPILSLPNLTIRPLHPSDAPSLAHHGNDPEVSKQMRDTFPHPYHLADAHHFITTLASQTTTNGVLLHYAICLVAPSSFLSTSSPSGAALIGCIGLKPLPDVEARGFELGYWLGREHWARGYATEAVRAFSRWAFETFPGLLRLEARVHEGNGGSEAVLCKAGYQREGVRRKAVWKGGRALDLVLFGMLRGECPGLGAGMGG